jgi:hypothetical protein
MASPLPPIQLSLTEEQQALIQRLSGQHAQVLELIPESTDAASGAGRALHFRWRLSVATGIPRQQWGPDAASRPAPPDESSPA